MAQSRQAGMFDSCLNKGYKQALEETAYRYETCCNCTVTSSAEMGVSVDHCEENGYLPRSRPDRTRQRPLFGETKVTLATD